MKGKLLIVFHSNHGYTKRYVDILGNAIGCDAVPANKLKADMLKGYDKILYIGSVRNDEVNGFKKFSEYLGGIYKKTILCGVGMMPYRRDLPERIKSATVRVDYEKFIPSFYVQGGFNVDELGRLEKFAIAFRQRQTKLATILNDEDTFFLNAIKTPFDEVKKENIQLLIDYIEGREVDDKLYSPPEITDEAEEKAFFDELEAAAKAPENKKKAIKKKIRKSIGKSAKIADESEDANSNTQEVVDSPSAIESEEKAKTTESEQTKE